MRYEILKKYPEGAIKKQWADFMRSADLACHYTAPEYFLEPYWEGKNPFAILAVEDGKVYAVATGLNSDSRVSCGLQVRPQVAFRRDSVRNEAVKALVNGANEIGANADLFTFNCWFRVPEFSELGFTEQEAVGAQQIVILDLSHGAEHVFKGFSQSRRSDIRKALREKSLSVEVLESDEDVKALHKIHLAWSARKDLTPETIEMMRAGILQQENRATLIAKIGKKVVAGSYFRKLPGGLFEYTGNNSDPDFLRFRPNDVLVWKAIEMACADGYKQMTLGASHLFLRRFGGDIHSTFRYQLDRSFLKRHEKREKLENIAIRVYQSIPFESRQRIKRVLHLAK